MRNEQLMRQWRVLRRLEGAKNGLTIGVVAREEKVHPRTLKRDVIALRRAGFPVLEERVRGERRWRLSNEYSRLMSFPVTNSELIALALARPQLRFAEGSSVATAMDELLGKVEASLAPAGRSLLARLRAVVSGDPPRAQYGDLPGRLVEAAAERRRIEIVYNAAWKRTSTQRKLDPYAVRLHDSALYLAAYDHYRHAVRLFAVERIRSLKVLGEHFSRPDFDADAYFAKPLGVVHEGRPYTVRLWFAAETAIFVEERPWHPSQCVARGADGSIEVKLQIDGLREVVWKVLSYGTRARAIGPPELVNLVATELRSAAAFYGPP